jgi:hypothetical protein
VKRPEVAEELRHLLLLEAQLSSLVSSTSW